MLAYCIDLPPVRVDLPVVRVRGWVASVRASLRRRRADRCATLCTQWAPGNHSLGGDRNDDVTDTDRVRWADYVAYACMLCALGPKLRLRFDFDSTALRPFDDLRYDRRPTCCGLLHYDLNKLYAGGRHDMPRPSPPPVGAEAPCR